MSATGRGVIEILDRVIADAGGEPSTTTVAIQGFGNVGIWAARVAYDRGYRVMAVSDLAGCLVDEGGIDVTALSAHVDEHRTIEGFERLARQLCRAYDNVRAVAAETVCTLRDAAYVIGVSRVAEASALRGKL